MAWRRHTLIDISARGRESLLTACLTGPCGQQVPAEVVAQVVLPELAGVAIPGIVRRGEAVDWLASRLPIGFCAPDAGPEGRLRFAATVSCEDVVGITSPYDLMARTVSDRTPCLEALNLLRTAAGKFGLQLGVWGSAALEIFTGLSYTHEHSDLDLLVAPAPRQALEAFLDTVHGVEDRFRLRIDVELDLADGFGVQLKELLSTGRTVLGKSIAEVALLPRAQVWSQLPDADSQGTEFSPVTGRPDSPSTHVA